MTKKVFVAGVGMTPFKKPGQADTYDIMGAAAVRAALADAGLDYADLQQAHVGWVYGDTPSGQQALYQVGITGIPVTNVNNACASGSTALWLAREAIANGAADCVIALGFEQMVRGALDFVFTDRPSTMGQHDAVLRNNNQDPDVLETFQFFGKAGSEYAEKHGLAPETFARISVKARQHAANNPLAIFRDEVTVEQVMASPHIFGPLTKLQCCPPTCGGAAAVLVSEDFAKRRGLDTTVEFAAQTFRTDETSSFAENSMVKVIGYDIAKKSAQAVYEAAGIGPDDVDLVELHDCFTTNELLTYEALGLCPEGGAEKFILDGDNTYGGKVVTNPSGGLLSKGHPLGATGLAQCYELTNQLRGNADRRQVEGARIALQHNLGLGSACVIGLYKRHG